MTIEQNDPLVGIVRLTQELQIPVSADDRLLEEQKAVVDFRFRKAQRSQELVAFKIETEIRLERTSNHLAFKTTVNNQSKDHRLRVLFPTGIITDFHEADSIYEVVKR